MGDAGPHLVMRTPSVKRARRNVSPPGYRYLSRKPPPGTPLAYWRSIRRVRVTLMGMTIVNLMIGGSLMVMVILIGVTGQISVPMRICEQYNGFLLLALWGLCVVAVYRWLPGTQRRRWVAFLRQHDCEVCSHCGYVLSRLPAQHKCPECGSAYEIERLRSEWETWIEGE